MSLPKPLAGEGSAGWIPLFEPELTPDAGRLALALRKKGLLPNSI
jgi:hypothetical protein